MLNNETKTCSLSFEYNRFADLFYYLLAHMPLDNAANEYDPEYVAEMKASLGISPEIPQEVIDYYGMHFDRVMIADFISLMVSDTWTFKGTLARCGRLMDEDMTFFVDPMINICNHMSETFYPWWEARHFEIMEHRAEAVYDSFRKLAERFRCFFKKLEMKTKVLFSQTLRNNGRAFNQQGEIIVYLKFPEKNEDITECFLQYLHECTHTITDPMMNQQILMSDDSHDIAEYQVLCFDEYLIAEVCPELTAKYREWVEPKYLDEAHVNLGDAGEKRLKERMKDMLQ